MRQRGPMSSSFKSEHTYGAGGLVGDTEYSFEGGVLGSWGNGWFGNPAAVTIAASNTRASLGTYSMRITFPTAAANCGPQLGISTLIAGRSYSARCKVYSPTGSPLLRWGNPFLGGTVNATLYDVWEMLTYVFTASSNQTYLVPRSLTATTAGQQCWVDEISVFQNTA